MPEFDLAKLEALKKKAQSEDMESFVQQERRRLKPQEELRIIYQEGFPIKVELVGGGADEFTTVEVGRNSDLRVAKINYPGFSVINRTWAVNVPGLFGTKALRDIENVVLGRATLLNRFPFSGEVTPYHVRIRREVDGPYNLIFVKDLSTPLSAGSVSETVVITSEPGQDLP